MIVASFFFALFGLVPIADDLSKTGATAVERRLPILLYVSRSDCTFCRQFEKEQFGPLLNSKVYSQQVIFRELVWDATESMIDFEGEEITRAEFAETFDAKLTPTVLFLDGEGEEIAPRITGYVSNDYFGYYFEAAIKRAIERAQSPDG